ncbi:MAG: TatD family hydrolase [Pseudomonadota bacterium]
MSDINSSTFFDSHCHFDFAEFDRDRELIWQQCRKHNIDGLLIPGTTPEQWPGLFSLAKTYPGTVGAVGVHPWWVSRLAGERLNSQQQQFMHECLQQPLCVALGECGLDGLIDLPLDRQQPIFEQQLALACEYQKPLVIHCRKAHNQLLALLARYRPQKGGVIHGFSGAVELARQYWRLGFSLGIGGTISYPRAAKTRRMVQAMPLDALLLETDAPDMPLNGYQGRPNSPLKVIDVAKCLAELRQETLNTIAQVTTGNARQLFQL